MSLLKTMPVEPQYLRAAVSGRPVGVDRKNNVIQGYVVAQEGIFKDRRGEFNVEALRQIVAMANKTPEGLKSRLGHPDMSSDGIGKFLGRGRAFSMGTAVDARTGKTVAAVRADLYLDPSAFKSPNGNLADYVMTLAESDPGAFSSSLVIKPRQEFHKDSKGRTLTDENGDELPPIWFPEQLHASDVVDTGDAVDAMLSAEQLSSALTGGITPELQAALKFDNVVRLSSQLLDGLFAGQPRDVIEARCKAYLDRYLARRFDSAEPVTPPLTIETPKLNATASRFDRMAATATKLRPKA